MKITAIQLRGVRVHNLRNVDLDIPHNRLTVVCGVSGSGKTSLALDTLYAEGQRRYIESFSAYTRQYLERLEKPDADRVEGIPPAVAVTHEDFSRASRATVGTVTEVIEYLRLLYARTARLFCGKCGRHIQRHSAHSAAEELLRLPAGTRLLLTFRQTVAPGEPWDLACAALAEQGFVRLIIGERLVNLGSDKQAPAELVADQAFPFLVVVDRLVVGDASRERLADSLETAFLNGQGQAVALVAAASPPTGDAPLCVPTGDAPLCVVEGQGYATYRFGSTYTCQECGTSYLTPEPHSFSFNSPLGACPKCEGSAEITDWDLDLVIPDRSRSLRDGGVAPWSGATYSTQRNELIQFAQSQGWMVDVPLRRLGEAELERLWQGDPESGFLGVRGQLNQFAAQSNSPRTRSFLNRWRSQKTCDTCRGRRLREESLAFKLDGQDIAELARLRIVDLRDFLHGVSERTPAQQVSRVVVTQILARLSYLIEIGLGYLWLDRSLVTLSAGEAHRVSLASALGSNLVNMLYVLDEPSAGLHPADVARLVPSIKQIRDRGNTVVVVEHEETLLHSADQVVEIGPGAGERGGRVTFQGTPAELLKAQGSVTADFLCGRRGAGLPTQRREMRHGWIRLSGARGNNLKDLTVDFPLGTLCVVTGVSGSGKTSLVQDTLYGALCRRLRKDGPKPLPFDDVVGDGQINDVVLVDQSPVGKTPRSNPVTYIKAFDEIRGVFASTLEARTHNYTAGHFSFNVEGGRCSVCEGDGQIGIDMQFLADVYMKCAQCGGKRYRKEILQVRYRGKNIADVLEMSVREAFSFFRGQVKVQTRLKQLIDVGLDYIRLGQPANSMSSGESQRLKLASHLTAVGRNRTLFILDEPTTGLHFADVVTLLDCFEALLSVGHSLLVVEHNLQLIKSADYIIDLGPGPGEAGGEVVVCGTPEAIAAHPDSLTGRHLAPVLRKDEGSNDE